MKAYVRVDSESPLVQLTEVATPKPDASEVLLAVAAFGVGIHDRHFIPPNGPFPYTIGIEAAGVVTEIGNAAGEINRGDRVIATTSMSPKGGTWAEYVAVDHRHVTVIPETMDFATAAAIPVAGKAAVESMHALDLKPGETLFVAGASGAIGTLVVQLASQGSARVVGSASAPNHDYLLEMGAQLAVDYRDPDWTNEVRRWSPGGVDAALAIQPGTPPSSLAVTRDGGRVITVSGDPCPSERDITVKQFEMRADSGEDMAKLIDDISTGRVRIVLEHIYPFDEALAALEKTETRHARGKLVVTMP